MSVRSFVRSFVRGFSSQFTERRAGQRRRSNKRLLVESLEMRRVMAVNPLLIDLDTTPNLSFAPPQNVVEVNGAVYFSAATRGLGTELWKSDGTLAGTQLVKDINPGTDYSSSPTNLVNFNGTLYFTAFDSGSGQSRIWKSDGTDAGTVPIVGSQNVVSPSGFTVVGSTLFFVALRGGANSTGAELWKTDGTSVGTVLVRDINRGPTGSNPQSLVNVGGTLFFVATTSSGTELWKSNGTAASTVQVRDIVVGVGSSYPQQLINSGGTLYFTANNLLNGTELWKSNGTSAGTVLVRDTVIGPSGSYPSYLTDVAGTVFFNSAAELWKSNGTVASTISLTPGTPVNPRSLANFNATLYFSASDGSGTELWQSNGTVPGTTLLKDINPAGSSDPSNPVVSGNTLFFTATTEAAGRELYKSDGTAIGTVLVKDILGGPYGSNLNSFAAASGKLFFAADNGINGTELWVSDGTPVGTTITRDIDPTTVSANPNGSVVVGTTQYFVATTPTSGTELWKTDGTLAGTVLVRDLTPGAGSSNPTFLTNVNGTLYFTADIGSGRELWKSNGTSAGTVLAANLNGGYSSNPQNFVNVGSTLYFTAFDNTNGRELWKSSGTAATTSLVSDINPGGSSYPSQLLAIGSTVYFTADNGTNGVELWKTNGTAAGTVLVNDILPDGVSSYPSELTAVGTTLYFKARGATSGVELWKSNGTLAGTVIVKNIVPDTYGGSYPRQLTNVNGVLYFSAMEFPNGPYELFKTNGTVAGTVVVEGAESLMNNPDRLTNVNNVLYFTAFEELGSTGVELWRSDGTPAGTTLVKDIFPGVDSASPELLFNANGALVFTVNAPSTGTELWKSDGTAAGTSSILDLRPGPASSNVTALAMLGSKLTFTADDGSSGSELFVLSPNQAPALALPASAVSATEDLATALTGISISDVDADVAAVQATFNASAGSLALDLSIAGGLVAAQVSGNGTASLTVTAPLAALNATLGSANGLSWTSALNQTASATVVVSVNDQGNIGLGPALSDTETLTINVAPVNDSPVLTINAGPIVAVENASATLLDTSATLVDVDSTNFDTGVLLVQLPAVESSDRVSVRNQGTGANLIGLSGTNVTFGGTIIGIVQSGLSGGNLSILLNANATASAVTALLRNLQFRTISENPSTAPRSLIVSLTDGDGGSSPTATVTANVVAVNDAPQITLPGSPVTYVENAAATLLDTAATASDAEGNWSGGTLTATIASGGSSNDLLEIVNQGSAINQISLLGSFIFFGTASGPVQVGAFSGGTGSTPLSISLTSNATSAAVAGILRNLTFRVQGDAPTDSPRTIRIQASDGLAAASALLTRTVTVTPVNDSPLVANLGAPISYNENAPAGLIAATATLQDVDSTDLAGGTVTVSLIANGTATDILAVRNQGTAAGQIGVSSTNVSFGGVVIGTLAGGTGLTPLVITLGSSATPTAVTALLQNVTYRANTEAPTSLPRSVQIVVTDGDGGTSAAAVQTVNVVPVNDVAIVGSILATNSYTENGAPVLLAPTASLSDVDSPNFAGGNLTVRYLSGGTADDRLSIRNEGFNAGQIGVAGLSILFGGQTIGTITSTGGIGTAFLRVTLNVNATPDRTRALLRNITYSNVSDAPATTARRIEFLVNDGSASSASVTQVMSVVAVNDAPTLTLPGAVGTYVSAAPPIDIDATATVVDPDSSNLATGVLTVSLTSNGTASDVLTIRNEGTAAGQIGVSGANVTFGGVAIGTFAGGSSSTPLTVTLNTSATPAAVQALVRKITFQVSGTVSSTLARTVGFQLTDGDGGTSSLVTKNVNVSL